MAESNRRGRMAALMGVVAGSVLLLATGQRIDAVQLLALLGMGPTGLLRLLCGLPQ